VDVSREAGTLQLHQGMTLDEHSIRQIIDFFNTLDRWERAQHGR
jgi:hypothetical protein